MENNNSIKVNLIFKEKTIKIDCSSIFLKTDNHEYSIFLNHEDLLLSLINSKIKFSTNKSVKKELEVESGLLFLKKNYASFFIEK